MSIMSTIRFSRWRCVTAVIAVVMAAVGATAATAQLTPPNVVFILADDLGVMDVGAFNADTFYETPHLDRLAADGMRFTAAYTACHVCSPTRYSILTGRYPVRSGITNYLAGVRSERFEPATLDRFMPLDETTLGEAFRDAGLGYRTAWLGKWHLGDVRLYGPQLQGFDVVSGDIRSLSPSASDVPLPVHPPLDRNDPYMIETMSTRITDDALVVLEAFRNRPFFLGLSFYQVHVPLGASEEFVAPYREKKQRLGLGGNPSQDFIDEEQTHLTNQPRRSRVRQNHAVYAGMVAHTDHCIGRVLNKLDELGLRDNTIVVFTSDNGGLATAEGSPTSNRPLRTGKGWSYEGGHRTPLIIRLPKIIPPNSVCDVPVITTDHYPTLLALAGLPSRPEQHLDGVNLAPLLRGNTTTLPRDAIYWHYPHYSNQGGFPASAVRVGDYKLIQRLEDGRVHLYDLRRDVSEEHDLASTMPDRVATMQQQLFTWYHETGARFLEPKDGNVPWHPFHKTP